MCILCDILFESHINYFALVHLQTRINWRHYLAAVTFDGARVKLVFLANFLEEKGGIVEAEVGVDREVCGLNSF